VGLARRAEPEAVGTAGRREVRKLEIVIEQLERAELYVRAAMEVELADAERRRDLEDLHATLRATCRSIRRPRIVRR